MPLRLDDARELNAKAAEAARLLTALANRHRLAILCALFEGERSVGALVDAVGLTQSALSQHSPSCAPPALLQPNATRKPSTTGSRARRLAIDAAYDANWLYQTTEAMPSSRVSERAPGHALEELEWGP